MSNQDVPTKPPNGNRGMAHQPFRVFLRENKYMLVFLLFLTLIAVLSVVSSVYTILAEVATNIPPLHIIHYEVVGGGRFCAGQEGALTYSVQVGYTRPAVLQRTETIFSVDENMTVIAASPQSGVSYYIASEPTTISRTLTSRIPALPVGKYELRQSLEDPSAPPLIYALPFVVTQCP